jgi:hypothetical protein
MALVGLAIVVVNVVRRRELGARSTVANCVGLVIFLGVTYLMVAPYLRVVDLYHFTRTLNVVQAFSPPPAGLLTASSQTWLWRGTFFDDLANVPALGAGEKLLFPGLVLIVFALVGLVVSAWSVRIRVGLGVAVVVVTVLALGTTFYGGTFTYLPLWRYLPGWHDLRTPGRLILWTILLLILLAAGAVTRLGQLLAERGRQRLAAFALLLPALGALLEGVPAQTYAVTPGIPPDVQQVFAQAHDPMLILPIDQLSEFDYLLWSTDGFPLIANGSSGNFPPQYQEILAASQSFPDSHSIAVLDKYGIHKVILLKVAAAATPYAAALNRPLDGLPVTKTESSDVVVFTLR